MTVYPEFTESNARRRMFAHHDALLKGKRYYDSMLRGVRIIMIHELDPQSALALKDKLRPDDILTWDDGLISQFQCIPLLMEWPNYVGISTAICEAATRQSQEGTYKPTVYKHCAQAHTDYRENGDASPYMTWEHVFHLEEKGAIIVGHGHTHLDLRGKALKDQVPAFQDELHAMKQVFKKRLGYVPIGYIYPYNFKGDVLDTWARHEGFTWCFGPERVAVEELLK